MKDAYQRKIRDLRISLIETCNYYCFYCKPRQQEAPLPCPGKNLLTQEEVVRFTKLFLNLGVDKIRLTGGEPMLRSDLIAIIEQLSTLGLQDLAMTTNAHFLKAQARALRAAGLQRLTVSLDSLNPQRFRQMTGRDALSRVLEGIDAANQAGFFPIKINVVVVRGKNDCEIVDFGNFARSTGNWVRFIEFMPLDAGKAWQRQQVVTQREILAQLAKISPLSPLPQKDLSQTANEFSFEDGRGQIGVIAPVSRPFCGQCSRLRLTADGKLRTCLFSQHDHDLLSPLRQGASNQQMSALIQKLTQTKEPGHRIGQDDFVPANRSMSSIGG